MDVAKFRFISQILSGLEKMAQQQLNKNEENT